MLIQGVVGLPSVSSNQATGANATIPQDQQGAPIVTELHGKYYVVAKSGNLFVAALTSAATIPVNAATLASKFCLVNPIGSGRNLELVDIDIDLAVANTLAQYTLVYQTGATAIAGLGTLTAGTIQNAFVGGSGQNSVCTFYTAAAHTGTPTLYTTLFGDTATGEAGNKHYDFDGKVLVPPGTIIDVATLTNAGPASGALVSLRWAEWPI